MKRIVLLLVAGVLVTAGLAAGPAMAAFPGRNGAIVFEQSVATFFPNPGGESAVIEYAIRVRQASGRQRRLAGCTFSTDAPLSGCTSLSYAGPAVSPDGRLVAFGAGTRLGVVPVAGGRVRLLPQHGEIGRAPAFSPDGRRLVFTAVTKARTTLMICDLACRRARTLAVGGDFPTWSARGWIAFVRDGAVYRVRPGGSGLRRLARHASAPTWSPDGRKLAFTHADVRRAGKLVRKGGVSIADADGRGARRLGASAPNGPAADLAWSPDGRRLLVLDAIHRHLRELDLHGRLLREHAWAFLLGGESVTTTHRIDWQSLR